MFTRRSFFRRAAAIVAAVALAPEIAFNVRLNPTELALEQLTPFWLETSCFHRYKSAAYIEWQQAVMSGAYKEFFA